MNPTETARARISKARAALILSNPFFAALALRLDVRPIAKGVMNCDTIGVDGKNLWFCPEWINEQKPEDLVTIVAHEAMHCALGHSMRRQQRDPPRWNQACDHPINLILKAASFPMPKSGLCDPKFAGMAAEQVYPLIPETPADPRGDYGGMGCVLDATGEDGKPLSEPDREAMEREWKIALIQAAQAAKAQGKLPACLDGLIEAVRAPTVDWRAVLREFVRSAAKNDYCIAPETLVLRADLTWCRADQIQGGDELIGVDEVPSEGSNHRRICVTTVEMAGIFNERRLRVTTEDTSIIVTPDHRFLVAGSVNSWRRAERLELGDKIKSIVFPWHEDRSDSWLAGMFDGEGTLTANPPDKPRSGLNLRIVQVAGPIYDRIRSELSGYRFGEAAYGEGHYGRQVVHFVAVSAIPDVFRLIGQYRPTRLLPKMIAFIRDGYFTLPRPGKSVITTIEHLEPGPVVSIKTSAKTLITNGLISHNCWRRPNTRFLASGDYLPSLYDETIGPLAIGVDTSGSVSQAELEAVCAELNGILDTVKPEFVAVAYCDARVHTHETFQPDDYPVKMRVVGRGGTDLRGLWPYYEEHDINPCCAIVCTDMELHVADLGADPGYPVLFCTTGRDHPMDGPVAFGTVIKVEAAQ